MTFVAKHAPVPGSPGNWRVYDSVTASYPYDRPGIGRVTQDVTKAEAEAEAWRLNHPDARPQPVQPDLAEWDVDF